MSKKTPNDKAREYKRRLALGCVEGETVGDEVRVAFLAGRADFIKSELPKLLEMAREGIGTESLYNDYTHTIEEIIAMAEKGET